MFAKVFEQIFDSTVAQDYEVRHMFIDLLILADPTGAVDMTPDAIARRTNVPQETVERCIKELCQPDVKSRSPLEEGKRLVPLDSRRDWGWKIVNYQHYRKIRDQEARRSYFRDYQRKRRKNLRVVKDKMVNKDDTVENSSSTSSSKSVCKRKPKNLEALLEYAAQIGISKADAIAFFDSMEAGGWTRGGKALKDWEAHLRSYKAQGWLASQRNRKNGAHPDNPKPVDRSKIDVPERFKSWAAETYPDKRESVMKWRTWADVPNSLRSEWWRVEKKQLPGDIGDLI